LRPWAITTKNWPKPAFWSSSQALSLNRQVEVAGDCVLADLLLELRDCPSESKSRDIAWAREFAAVVVPLQLNSASGVLSFFITTTAFTPVDITLSELAIESFFPADAATAEAMRRLCFDRRRGSTGRDVHTARP
jgi:hypothetical protein